MKKFFVLLVLFFSCFSFIFSQESPGSDDAAEDGQIAEDSEEEEKTPDEVSEETPQLSPEQEILELDIRTSSLMELASWCRSLGLSEGGTREELSNRLRRNFDLPTAGRSVSDEGKIIVIESARTTEYFTLEVVDEEYARLRGNVVINLKDGNSVHRIKAWEITYNRTRNVMTATGGVEYIKETEDTIETFKGESITVNLDNWSSIFVDGFSERSSPGGGTAYRFAGTVISRNSEDATILTRAEITNGKNEDSLWSLNASKLWLLPGGSDWAVLNAVLKVGNIPVLWLPFFFYPSDEIVFHPVLGYRTREGTFVQTTTYILGRPKSSGFTENSITRIFGSTGDTEKVREGLFLRSSGKKARPVDEVNLSVIFDAYANMGAYLGTELTIPKKSIMDTINLSFGLGLTRNIYQAAYGSTPFKNQDGVSEWNSGYLFSLELPLRYRFETKSSLSWQFISLSWNIPFYSDPFVNRDFLDRSEELDWLAMIREGASAEPLQTTENGISSYGWTLSGSVNPRIPALNPYISSLSISSISSSMNFSTRNNLNYDGPSSFPNPDRSFFVPGRLSVSLSASTSGTPFTLGESGALSSSFTENKQEAPGDSLLPALPRQPWEDASTEESSADNDPHKLEPPVLSQRFSRNPSGGPQLSFDYRIAPTGGFEQQFRNNPDWENASDIDLDVSSRLFQAGATASMGFSLSQPAGIYSSSFRLNGRGNWQDYTYLNEDSEEYQTPERIEAARSRVHSQTNINSSYDFTASYSPFFRNRVWGASNISYSLSGLIGNYRYDDSDEAKADKPRWIWEKGEWDENDVGTHQAGINLAANVMDHTQNFSINSTLWPKETILSGNAVVRAWISETRAQTSIFEPYDEVKREFRPIDLTETLRFASNGSFQLSMRYEPEAVRETNPDPVKEAAFTSLKTTLSLYGFNASYTASYMIPYMLDPGTGWIQDGTSRKFESQSLGFSYSKNQSLNNLWNNRLSMSFRVDTGFNFDLQRYTYSSFNFTLVFTTKITNFLDFGLSVSSTNSQIYQYFQSLPFFTSNVDLNPELETSFFRDLLNSFRFDDDNLRRSSGFKAKSFTLDLTHHLGDWNAKLKVNLAPYMDDTGVPPVWKHNYQVSFLIQWVPIEEIKTEFVYDDQQITFK